MWMFIQAPGLGFRKIHCHRREQLCFFAGKQPLSRGAPFPSLPVEVGRYLMIQSFTGFENKAV